MEGLVHGECAIIQKISEIKKGSRPMHLNIFLKRMLIILFCMISLVIFIRNFETADSRLFRVRYTEVKHAITLQPIEDVLILRWWNARMSPPTFWLKDFSHDSCIKETLTKSNANGSFFISKDMDEYPKSVMEIEGATYGIDVYKLGMRLHRLDESNNTIYLIEDNLGMYTRSAYLFKKLYSGCYCGVFQREVVREIDQLSDEPIENFDGMRNSFLNCKFSKKTGSY
jgi:hypothetical protein